MPLVKIFGDWMREFQDRLGLWRKMLATTGVKLPQNPGPEVREVMRRSMMMCASCESTADCAAWLVTARKNVDPPDFCPISHHIQRLKSEAA